MAEGELAVTTISATGSNGNSLSYSLSGEDSALFAISNAGVLRFLQPADYSAPADANRDNIYSFSVSVADGEATSKLEVSVTVVKKLTDFEQGIFQDLPSIRYVVTPAQARIRLAAPPILTSGVQLRRQKKITDRAISHDRLAGTTKLQMWSLRLCQFRKSGARVL